MTPSDFAKLCYETSLIPNGTAGVKEVPENLQVKYAGAKYYPTARIVRYENGRQIVEGVLHDLKANSTLTAELSKIERVIE